MVNISSLSRGRRSRRVGAGARTSFFRGGERLEDRSLMANDLYVNTHVLWGGDVTPGDQNIPVAEFQMIGRNTVPTSLTFPSETGSAVRDVAQHPELKADLYGRDARGRLTLRPDGNFETLVGRGNYDAEGNLSFRMGGIATVLAQRGTPLQVQVDVAQNAEDGMPIAFGLPTVGFLNPRLRSNVYYVGEDNPVYAVDGIEDIHMSFDLTSSSESISPGDQDISLGKLTVTSDDEASLYSVYVGIEGRHADNSVIADVDRVTEDYELYDVESGFVYHGTSVGEVGGLEIVRFDWIYADGDTTLEIRMDQEGTVASGDKFRAHVVVEDTANPVNVAGLTGLTTDYNLDAHAFGNDHLITSPGGVLTGNFRKVEIPQLNVAVLSIGANDTAVRNEKNVNLLAFETRATGGDLLVTEAAFTAATGTSLQNASNYTWWVDTDGNNAVDTIVQRGVTGANGRVVFNALVGGGYVVPNEGTLRSEIHADIASSLTADRKIQLALDGASVKAEALSTGASLASSQIVVTNQPSKLYKLVDQGDLFVTLDSTPTRSRQLLEGTLEQTILRLQLRAQNESIDVTKLYVSATGVVTSIDRLELYRDGATTPFAVATIGGAGSDPVPAGYTTFVANMQNRQLVVPDGENLDILVRPRMKSDEQGGLSGEAVKLNLVVAAGFQPVLARGDTSSNNLMPNNGDAVATGEVIVGADSAGPNAAITGNANVVVGSKFSSFTNANPDADNSNVPTGISPFAQFKITTATNANTLNGLNKAALDSFVIYVNATNVSMDASAFKLYNKADSSTKVAVVAESLAGVPITGQVTGSFRVRVTNLAASAVDAIFESGESSTLVLEGNVLNAKVNSSLSSALQGSLDLTDQYFTWFDQDAGGKKKIIGVEYPETVIRSTSYRS